MDLQGLAETSLSLAAHYRDLMPHESLNMPGKPSVAQLSSHHAPGPYQRR
jgi:hypothetical protein